MEGTGFNEVPAFIRDGVLPSPTKILAHARHTVHQKLARTHAEDEGEGDGHVVVGTNRDGELGSESSLGSVDFSFQPKLILQPEGEGDGAGPASTTASTVQSVGPGMVEAQLPKLNPVALNSPRYQQRLRVQLNSEGISQAARDGGSGAQPLVRRMVEREDLMKAAQKQAAGNAHDLASLSIGGVSMAVRERHPGARQGTTVLKNNGGAALAAAHAVAAEDSAALARQQNGQPPRKLSEADIEEHRAHVARSPSKSIRASSTHFKDPVVLYLKRMSGPPTAVVEAADPLRAAAAAEVSSIVSGVSPRVGMPTLPQINHLVRDKQPHKLSSDWVASSAYSPRLAVAAAAVRRFGPGYGSSPQMADFAGEEQLAGHLLAGGSIDGTCSSAYASCSGALPGARPGGTEGGVGGVCGVGAVGPRSSSSDAGSPYWNNPRRTSLDSSAMHMQSTLYQGHNNSSSGSHHHGPSPLHHASSQGPQQLRLQGASLGGGGVGAAGAQARDGMQRRVSLEHGRAATAAAGTGGSGAFGLGGSGGSSSQLQALALASSSQQGRSPRSGPVSSPALQGSGEVSPRPGAGPCSQEAKVDPSCLQPPRGAPSAASHSQPQHQWQQWQAQAGGGGNSHSEPLVPKLRLGLLSREGGAPHPPASPPLIHVSHIGSLEQQHHLLNADELAMAHQLARHSNSSSPGPVSSGGAGSPADQQQAGHPKYLDADWDEWVHPQEHPLGTPGGASGISSRGVLEGRHRAVGSGFKQVMLGVPAGRHGVPMHLHLDVPHTPPVKPGRLQDTPTDNHA